MLLNLLSQVGLLCWQWHSICKSNYRAQKSALSTIIFVVDKGASNSCSIGRLVRSISSLQNLTLIACTIKNTHSNKYFTCDNCFCESGLIVSKYNKLVKATITAFWRLWYLFIDNAGQRVRINETAHWPSPSALADEELVVSFATCNNNRVPNCTQLHRHSPNIVTYFGENKHPCVELTKWFYEFFAQTGKI